MAEVSGKPRILLIGGTSRALATLISLLQRDDIDVSMCVFMSGYADEQINVPELENTAKTFGIPYVVSDKITNGIMNQCRQLRLDAILGIGNWRSMLAKDFLEVAKHGYLAIHGTPLPGYRGWAGIYWQIINGEKTVTMRAFRLGEGMDSGPILCDGEGNSVEGSVYIDNEMHLGEILEKYDEQHIILTHKILDLLSKNEIEFKEQDESYATYSCHRGPEDGEINWNDSTRNVFNFIRAQSSPLAGAFTYYKGKKVIVWRIRPRYDYSNYIGRIIGKVVARDTDSGNVVILTSDGGIEVIDAEIRGNNRDMRPFKIFDSVRERCKSRVEAFIDSLELQGSG